MTRRSAATLAACIVLGALSGATLRHLYPHALVRAEAGRIDPSLREVCSYLLCGSMHARCEACSDPEERCTVERASDAMAVVDCRR